MIRLVDRQKKLKHYIKPEITRVEIDQEISLIMQSANPGGDPDEFFNPGNFIQNPFKINQ